MLLSMHDCRFRSVLDRGVVAWTVSNFKLSELLYLRRLNGTIETFDRVVDSQWNGSFWPRLLTLCAASCGIQSH